MPHPYVPAALCVLALSAPLAAQDAYALLDKVRRAYSALATYHDRGTIEIAEGDGTRVLGFETAVEDGGAYLLALSEDGEPYRVLWRDAAGAFLYAPGRGELQPLGSVRTGIVALFGQGGLDALVVAGALAKSRAALEDPEAAAVEGEATCGDATCLVLRLERMDETIVSRLLVDPATSLIREVEVELRPADGRWTAAVERSRIRVRHEIEPLPPELLPFVPPSTARRVEEIGIEDVDVAETAPPPAPGAGEADLVFDDEISVELVTLVVRVMDPKGAPLRGLVPADFEVTSAGQEVPVSAVDWVSSDPAERDEALVAELARHGFRLPPNEKYVVFFVQPSLIASRLSGHMRILPHLRKLVETLQPNDWAAVVSFDSRLRLRLDFTRYHDEVGEALEQTIRSQGEPRLRRSRASYLSRHVDLREARDAATPDRGLELVARALEHAPGAKVLVYVGWGLDPESQTGFDYAPAREALLRSNTTVFVLDVTTADYHTLEFGLRDLADDTGGLYEKTHLFPKNAAARISRVMSGYYVLTLVRQGLPEKRARLRIRLREKKGRVLVPPTSG